MSDIEQAKMFNKIEVPMDVLDAIDGFPSLSFCYEF